MITLTLITEFLKMVVAGEPFRDSLRHPEVRLRKKHPSLASAKRFADSRTTCSAEVGNFYKGSQRMPSNISGGGGIQQAPRRGRLEVGPESLQARSTSPVTICHKADAGMEQERKSPLMHTFTLLFYCGSFWFLPDAEPRSLGFRVMFHPYYLTL